MLQNLAHAEQMKVDGTVRNEIECRQQLDDLNREQVTIRVSGCQFNAISSLKFMAYFHEDMRPFAECDILLMV